MSPNDPPPARPSSPSDAEPGPPGDDGRGPEPQPLRPRAVTAATRLFAACGYAATTMRTIAEDLDVTVAAVWHHFRTKDSLLQEVLAPLLADLDAEVTRAERWPATGAGAGPLLGGVLDVWLRHRLVFAFLSRDLNVLHHRDVQSRVDDLNARLRAAVARAAGLDPADHEAAVAAAAALGCLARPVVNLDLDLEHHRQTLVLRAVAALAPVTSQEVGG